MADLHIPDSLLEELRCSVCKDYLSSAPVQVLPDGKSICIACAHLTEQPTHRVLVLESLLNKLVFPCRFNEYGCKERVPFGKAAEHQDKCSFQTFICPCFPIGSCTWNGSVTQISEHFTKQHVNLVQEKLEFKLQVDKDEQGILLTTFETVPLIMKYKYNSSTSTLHLDVRHLALNIQEGIYKIQLINDLDHDYSNTMKGGACLPFENQFYGTQETGHEWKVLFVNNFLPILNNPSCIVFAINAKVSKCTVEFNEKSQLAVDYDLIETLKCRKCYGYLIPPLYRNDHYSVVCFYCCDNNVYTIPIDNHKLNDRVTKAHFPCHWRGCNVIEKSYNIREHELMCRFRIFICKDCKKNFMWEEARPHVESHGYEYFTDKCVYKISYSKTPRKKIVTFKNNEIVYTNYELIYDGCKRVYSPQFEMFHSGSYSSNITAKVEIEHAHCKIKSKTFNVSKGTVTPFCIDDLPPCFTYTDELTVTVKI